MRRRKKKSGNMTSDTDTRTIEELPVLDTYCSECLRGGLRERQRESPGGATCKFGHGGDPGVSYSKTHGHAAKEVREILTRAEATDPGFEVREGDRLTVMYHGAKLQIAPYNSVELDGGIYSRTLLPGDDLEEQWDRIHTYLERKALERARAKLRSFSDELRIARENVKTGSAYDQ